jgi:hypothetical protein
MSVHLIKQFCYRTVIDRRHERASTDALRACR